MTLRSRSNGAGAWAQRVGQAISRAASHPHAPWAIAGFWFVLTFTVTLWVWGLNPLIMMSPDEAVNRFGASLISKQGNPFLHLPFADPEDLAHPRHWVTVGDHAIPAYSPVMLYFFALLLRFHWLGLVVISALPASGAAAFAAGTASLLPPGRRWLSLLAPALGFPALYWLLRPWMNLSLLLICVCWAFYFATKWHNEGRKQDLTTAIFLVGAAVAVRPDYAAYLMLAVLLFTLAMRPTEWKRILLLVLAAGASAVAINLVLNKLTTGHATRAAYQIVAARDEGNDGPSGPLGLLRQLVLPMGIPQLSKVVEFFRKYWLEMGPIAALTLGQLALVPLLLRRSRLERVLYALGILVLVCFMLSRMDPELAGAIEHIGKVHHSMPRYWSPVYLLAALPPILFLGYCRNRFVLALGATLACAAALASGYDICRVEESSFRALRRYAFIHQRQLENTLSNEIPRNAIVYSNTYDKGLWSRWRVATIDEPEPTAASMKRAVDANLDVFVCELKARPSVFRPLARALLVHGLSLVTVDGRAGVYHVQRAEP